MTIFASRFWRWDRSALMTRGRQYYQSQIEQRLPWIKQVSVRKQWPDELKIHLVEYVPIARWNDQHMVDADGNSFSVPRERTCQQAKFSNVVWP